MTDLGSLGGGISVGNGINASGQVTGFAWLGTVAEAHAFITNPATTS